MKVFVSKHRLLFLHLAFWVLFISYRLFDYTQYLTLEQALVFFGVPMIFNIIISYLHYFLLLPLLFEKKDATKYVLFLLLSMAVVMYFRFLTDDYVVAPFSSNDEYYAEVHLARVLSVLWGFLSFMVFTVLIKLAVNWFDLESRRKKLENEKLVAELNYLKSQINPHFLFNTLHNLNYLAQQKDDATSGVIIRLSNIMRFMIYDSNKEEVALSKEVQYMQDYIDLEKIRLNKPFDLNFSTTGSLDNINIAPLLLFTCLENAFKHGVGDKYDGCWISVDLKADKHSIEYKVSNSRLNLPSNSQPSGFGLKNLKKRLALHYPNRFEMIVEEGDEVFEIHLKIDIS